MDIEPGSSIAHYQIISRLGAGGMGEVYKAHDTVLGRTVALKILPADLVRNEERLRRFIQEARSASSLNHPHIVTIYEIGQDHAIHYIAMELVEGVTLRHKIHNEPASLRTLVTYLAQAAEGLAKAHGAGIVHRDLKPENIMVSADGFAKVLDFGLAKLTGQSAATGDAHARTITRREETREGVILGTVAYMSPEQVQGKPADHRSDIFALGTILYEAATRRRPFAADSDVEVMHKILHDKPEPVADLNPQVPAELRRTIRRCLAKEPDRRFQSMKDVAIELTEIAEEYEQLSLGSSSSSSSGSAALPSPLNGSPRTRTAWGAALIAAVLAAGAFTAYQWRHARADAGGQISFGAMKIRPLTTSGRVFRAPAISPDGKYVAYVTRDDGGFSLWMRQIATGSEVRIIPAQKTQVQSLAFSPDGNYLYYGSSDEGSANFVYSGLYVVPTIGGQPRKVVDDIDTAPAFSPDGRQIAFGRGVPAERQNYVMVANADGSGARRLASFRRMTDVTKPVWSPDGTKIVTAVVEMNPAWNVATVEIDAASGATHRLDTVRRFSMPGLAYLPDGSGLLLAAADAETAREQLWLQPYPGGTPLRVTNDLSDYGGLSITRDASTIAAVKTDTRSSLVLSAVDDTTPGAPLKSVDLSRLYDVAAARSGVIAYSFATGNATDIAVLDTLESAPRVLTHGGNNWGPSISGDGRIIVFNAEPDSGTPHVFAVNADGSNLRQVTTGSGEGGADISADGRMLAYSTKYGDELWVRAFEGGEARRISERATGGGRLSPDGRYVAFLEWQSAERAASNLRVVPVAGGSARLDVTWVRGLDFRWHPGGAMITFRQLETSGTNLFGIPISGGEPKRLTRFQSGTFKSYDWTSDGRLVLVRSQSSSDIVLISDWRGGR